MEHSEEVRKFSRVTFHITATARVGDQQFVGAVENLSLRGLFMLTDKKLAVDEEVEIIIALNDQPENGLSIDGRVVRLTNDGIAFVFDKIEFDTYIHLKRLIELNIGDADKMDEEMESFFH